MSSMKMETSVSRSWLEVRIPISPVDHYFNRVRFIAHSLRSLGGRYRDVAIRVTVGSEQTPEDLHARLPWSRALGIEWHWVDVADFVDWKDTAHPYIATMMERFRPPYGGENVLMLDADVIVLRSFDELFKQNQSLGVIGVMAHVSPFGPLDHTTAWEQLYRLAGLGQPKFDFALSGWGLMDTAPNRRLSPPYFNTGVLLGSAAALEELYAPYLEAMGLVRQTMDTYFIEQIALTLALIKTGLPYRVAPVRYNFPNDRLFDQAYRDELDEIRFLHFLRTDIVRRDADFASNATITALIERRDLTDSNELFRARLAALAPLVFKSYDNSTNINAPY